MNEIDDELKTTQTLVNDFIRSRDGAKLIKCVEAMQN